MDRDDPTAIFPEPAPKRPRDALLEILLPAFPDLAKRPRQLDELPRNASRAREAMASPLGRALTQLLPNGYDSILSPRIMYRVRKLVDAGRISPTTLLQLRLIPEDQRWEWMGHVDVFLDTWFRTKHCPDYDHLLPQQFKQDHALLSSALRTVEADDRYDTFDHVQAAAEADRTDYERGLTALEQACGVSFLHRVEGSLELAAEKILLWWQTQGGGWHLPLARRMRSFDSRFNNAEVALTDTFFGACALQNRFGGRRGYHAANWLQRVVSHYLSAAPGRGVAFALLLAQERPDSWLQLLPPALPKAEINDPIRRAVASAQNTLDAATARLGLVCTLPVHVRKIRSSLEKAAVLADNLLVFPELNPA